jgi:hypothetical protein
VKLLRDDGLSPIRTQARRGHGEDGREIDLDRSRADGVTEADFDLQVDARRPERRSKRDADAS